MTKKIDLAGKKFGRWTVVSEVDYDSHKYTNTMWNCICECGTERAVLSDSLRRGVSESCGCLKKEQAIERFTTHGMSKSVEYRHYAGMLSRCSDRDDKNYADYGARGITVCQEFLDDFMNFYNEIGPKPQTGERWSVGRIDNNRGYEIGNVRWELDTTQARNHSLQKNNTSGVGGVNVRYTDSDGDRVIARYNTLDGKRISKSFSILRYGLDGAMKLAVEWRTARIEELNAQGAGYAESHGTKKEVVYD